MKKMFALFLAMMMVMSLAACGGNSAGNGSSAPEPENPVNSVVEGTNDAIEASGLEWKDISMAFCASTTGNDTMKVISEAVKGAIEAKGGSCEVFSADGDAANQISQVENAVQMGCNVILVMAVENDALADAVQKAKDAGVLALTLSTDVGTQDCCMSSGDEKAMGMVAVDMAVDWVSETFEPGTTITTAIIRCEDSTEAAYRCTAYDDYADEAFAAAGYTLDKVADQTVTWTYEAGQEAAENIILQHPEVNLWLCYNGVTAQGTAEAVMTSNAIEDVSKVGVFDVDCSTDIAEQILASANNESVLRGAVSTGSLNDFANMPCDVIEIWMRGEAVPATWSLTPFTVDVSSAEEFIVEYGE